MIDRCLADQEIGIIDELPADDPRARHLEDCPRCRARLRSYRDFIAGAPPPAGDREATARRELAAALDREILGPTARPVARPRQRLLFLAARPGPILRPALGVAAVALLVAGVWQLAPSFRPGGPSGVMRGGEAPGASDSFETSAAVRADGRPEIAWTPCPGADEYEVLLFGADLRQLARFDAGAATRLVIEPEGLPRSADAQEALFARVVARHGGDEISRSNLVTVTIVPR